MSLTGDVLGQIGAEVSLNGGVGGSIQFTGEGTDNYDELDNRPSINGVVLTGNKTTADLHIDTGGTDDYLDLNNKPKINSVTLRGDVSSASLQISYNDLTDRPVIPDLTDLENRMDAVEGDIQSIETDIGDIGDRLIDIASDIATIQATDLVQNSDISSLKNRMNAAETSITNLGSRLTTAEGNITGLDNRLGVAEDNISDAQNDISDLQGDVTSLDTIVGNGQQTVGSDLTDAVTQLKSRLAISAGTITPSSGVTVQAYTFVKIGHICVLSFALRCPNISSGGTIATLPYSSTVATFNTVQDNDNIINYLKVEGNRLITDIAKTSIQIGLVIGEIVYITRS